MSDLLQKIESEAEMNENTFTLMVAEMRRMNENIEKVRDEVSEDRKSAEAKHAALKEQFLISHATLKGEMDVMKVKSTYISAISTIIVNAGISAAGWIKTGILNH